MKKNTTHIFLLLLCILSMIGCSPVEPSPSATPGSEMKKSPKRGVGFSFGFAADLPLLSDAISWYYNWGNTPNSTAAAWFDANGVDFCPMCWNGNYNKDAIRAYVKAHPNTKYLLAFNEPNLTDQANMVPKTAAKLWPDVKALANELGLQLVGPAMNYGTLDNYYNPIKWYDEWLAQPEVSLDDFVAIPLHNYMGSQGGLEDMIHMFAKYNKDIWMTEFCAWEMVSSFDSQMTFMCSALNYMETEKLLTRYAWFMPRTDELVNSRPYNQLLDHNFVNPGLTDLGRLYCNFSTFDRTTALISDKFVYGGQYIEVSSYAIQTRPTTDDEMRQRINKDGNMLYNILAGSTVTYLIHSKRTKNLHIRYNSFSNADLTIMVDGQPEATVKLPRTGTDQSFEDFVIPVDIAAGNHNLTLFIGSGACTISGFYTAE